MVRVEINEMKSAGRRKLIKTALAALAVVQCTFMTRPAEAWKSFGPVTVTDPDGKGTGEPFWNILKARTLLARIEEAKLCFQLWYEVLNEADVLTRRKTFNSMEAILEEREL